MRTTACEMKYPMYALPVEAILELEAFVDHQTLLRDSKLVKVEPGMDVIFVSHQVSDKP